MVVALAMASAKVTVPPETLRCEPCQFHYIEQKLDELNDRIDALDYNIREFLDRWNVAVFEATAYSPRDDRNGINSQGNPNITALGYISGPGKFAVDFSVIPPHSQMWVQGEGWGVAGDTGGAIRGNRVDIYRRCFDQAMSFGRQKIIVVYERVGR